MAYRRGSWRRKAGGRKAGKQFNVPVEEGFQARVKQVAIRLRGQWDMSGVVELGVEVLERLDRGEEVKREELYYPVEMTVEDQKEMLRDAGLLKG